MPVRLLTFTWNVGNREPAEAQLEYWLPERGGDFDVIVVGTQENRYKQKGRSSTRRSSARSSVADVEESDDDEEDEEDEQDMSINLVGRSREELLESAPPSDGTMGPWEEMVKRRLGNEWGLCKMVTLWEMRLAVFARENHLSGEGALIHSVQSARSATGIGSVMGNKGGLVITLHFGRMSMCFVSCHLAAHAHKLSARNANLQEILRETKQIGMRGLDVAAEFDHCFWIGDLNYRLDPRIVVERAGGGDLLDERRSEETTSGILSPETSMSMEVPSIAEESEGAERSATAPAVTPPPPVSVQGGIVDPIPRSATRNVKPSPNKKQLLEQHLTIVHDLLNREQWESLIEMDQLKHAQEGGYAFAGFQEGTISWPPTFKVKRVPGLTYNPQRVPSYCDRVLWKSLPTVISCVEQTKYNPVPEVSTSDHKPIVAHFTISVPPMPPERPSLGAVHGGHYRVQIKRLQLTNILAADLGGTSDPYLCFYTSPRGVLEVPGVRTNVKWKVPGIGATGGAVLGERLSNLKRMTTMRLSNKADGDSPSSAPGQDSKSKSGKPSVCLWDEHELPLLKLKVAAHESLESVCLIIAIFDKDSVGTDDALGVVTLPLGRHQPGSSDRGDKTLFTGPDGTPASAPPTKQDSPQQQAAAASERSSMSDSSRSLPLAYKLRLDAPIIFGHTEPPDGQLRCEMEVDFKADKPKRSNASGRSLQRARSLTAIEDSAILEKVRRQEAATPWYIIDPRSSRFFSRWSKLLGLALVFTALVTPWEVSFLTTSPVALFIVNRFVDLIFIIDVAVNFLVMYQEGSEEEGRRWVFQRSKIAWRYTKGWLFFDVISIVPSAFDIQSMAIVGGAPANGYGFTNNADESTSTNNLMLLRVLRGFRLLKLLRLVRGSRLIKRWQARVALSWTALRTIQLLVTLLLTMHWFACVLALQTAFSNPLDTWLGRYGHCGVDVDGDAICAGKQAAHQHAHAIQSPPLTIHSLSLPSFPRALQTLGSYGSRVFIGRWALSPASALSRRERSLASTSTLYMRR